TVSTGGVVPGLARAIQLLAKVMDARLEPGHDEPLSTRAPDYKIRMMKLQMRVGGMFWCAPPPPADWIEMPVPAKLMPMPVAAAWIEIPLAAGCVVPQLGPPPQPAACANTARYPVVGSSGVKRKHRACARS